MSFLYITPTEYRVVAGCWFLAVIVLGFFWTAILRRFATILKPRGKGAPGIPDMLGYLFRSEYRRSGDQRLISVCGKLRNLLFAYIGVAIAFVVFLVVAHPKY